MTYATRPDFWVLTVYYNPCNYQSRRNTYDRFIKKMRDSKVNVLTVECAFGDDPFVLKDTDDVIRVRGKSLLWQKERLLNIGAEYLPKSAKYVAWVDCDIIFKNENWIHEACERLSTDCKVVQLFETCTRLNRDDTPGDQVRSFAAVTVGNEKLLSTGRYDDHGHTGYAWAMRREIFDEIGLYEHAITGSADHFMSHAIFNEYGPCIENAVKKDPAQVNHLKEWGERFYELVQGKLGAVSGEIHHLWHGNLDRRQYFARMWKVTEAGWNPNADVTSNPGCTLEWCNHVHRNKPELVNYFSTYFESRQEDLS